jgi:hypothetical protein
MEVAWTTVVIIALLLPGVFFFIGYSTGSRYSREIVRSSAIGEVGLAVFISIIIHLLAWSVVALIFDFDLTKSLRRAAGYDSFLDWLIVDGEKRILPLAIYVLATALVGLGVGAAISWAIRRGRLRFLVTHKWISEVARSMRDGLVTAYVMTRTVENNRVLMYKGVLAEFYQDKEGKFVYIVLKTCSRYFMTFEDASPKTGEQLQLFGGSLGRSDRIWEFLQIDGENIANILFDPSPQIVENKAGTEALNTALREFQEFWVKQSLTPKVR